MPTIAERVGHLAYKIRRVQNLEFWRSRGYTYVGQPIVAGQDPLFDMPGAGNGHAERRAGQSHGDADTTPTGPGSEGYERPSVRRLREQFPGLDLNEGDDGTVAISFAPSVEVSVNDRWSMLRRATRIADRAGATLTVAQNGSNFEPGVLIAEGFETTDDGYVRYPQPRGANSDTPERRLLSGVDLLDNWEDGMEIAVRVGSGQFRDITNVEWLVDGVPVDNPHSQEEREKVSAGLQGNPNQEVRVSWAGGQHSWPINGSVPVQGTPRELQEVADLNDYERPDTDTSFNRQAARLAEAREAQAQAIRNAARAAAQDARDRARTAMEHIGSIEDSAGLERLRQFDPNLRVRQDADGIVYVDGWGTEQTLSSLRGLADNWGATVVFQRQDDPALATQVERHFGTDPDHPLADEDEIVFVSPFQNSYVTRQQQAVVQPTRRSGSGGTKKPATEIISEYQDYDDSDALYEALTAIYEGEFGGLRVEIVSIDPPDYGGFTVAAVIRNQSGTKVGSVTRVVDVDHNGDLFATHEYLSLESHVQGQGFAKEFNANLEEWYRASGVRYIAVHANIDVGGYAWARQGYDFSEGHVPGDIISKMESWLRDQRDDDDRVHYAIVDETEEGLRVTRADGTAADVADQDAVVAAAIEGEQWRVVGIARNAVVTYYAVGSGGELLSEHSSLRAATDDLNRARAAEEYEDGGDTDDEPYNIVRHALREIRAGREYSAFDISELGRRSGDTTWPGKEIMLGTDWDGVKWL